MGSHTIKVTGVSEELLRLLDQKVRAEQATGRAEYIRELIRRDVLTPTPSPAGWPSPEMPLRDLLAPVQEEAERLGESEEETENFLHRELQAHRQERRGRSRSGAK